MRWASSISAAADDLAKAVEQASTRLEQQLAGADCDLLLAFISREHSSRWHELPAALRDRFPRAQLLGCTGGGVIGDGLELEQTPGLALAGASLPGVEFTSFHLPAEKTPDPAEPGDDPSAERERWNAALGLAPGPDPHLILLPDPFTWTGPELLDSLDRAYPSGVKIGGLSSGGSRAGEHRLFCDRSAHHRGMVGVALRGAIEVDTVIAQGCDPIGVPMFVTRHQQQVIFELDGRPALEVLRSLFDTLDESDRGRARHSLLLGVVMDPQREIYYQGDFLIRNIVGVDPQTGALATASPLYENAVVQFHLHNTITAAADLHGHLAVQAKAPRPAAEAREHQRGRGQTLYPDLNYESSRLRAHLGDDLPIAGFFGNGEIGPVSGRTHLHGYTSAIMLIREP